MTGSLVDWVAATGAAAVDLELTNHYGTDYDKNLKVLKALLNWRR
jgi:predicted double-glycine peptidase